MIWNIIKLLLFTSLIPGSVVALIPWYIIGRWEYFFEIGAFKFIGVVIFLIGLTIYVISALSFLFIGKGTPFIWFARELTLIFGEEPVKLVEAGVYKRSRNPMYIGVISMVLGEGLFMQSYSLVAYGAVLIVLFNIAVILIEEPHLKKKYGKDYLDYIEQVPRWFKLF